MRTTKEKPRVNGVSDSEDDEELEARLENLISDAIQAHRTGGSEEDENESEAKQRQSYSWSHSYYAELRRYRQERYDLIRKAAAAESNGKLFDSIEQYKKLLVLSSDQFLNAADQRQACENLCRLYLKMGQTTEYEYFQQRMRRNLEEARNVFDNEDSKALMKKIDDNLSKTGGEKLSRAPDTLAQETSEHHMSEVETLAARLKKPPETRSSEDANAILEVIQSNAFLSQRLNQAQMQDLTSIAYHETHQEGFYLYKEKEFASKAWLLLGCSPFLEDYAGSVDIYMRTGAERSDCLSHVIHKGELIGRGALEGKAFRTDTAIVSDDGHDDVITHNHFLTINVEDFTTVLHTFHHHAFRLSPTQTSLDCSFMFLGDAVVQDLCSHLVASDNQCLQMLVLKYNNLTAVGARRIGDLLRSTVPLAGLDLSHNMLGDEGFKELYSALRENSSLTSLSLRANGLTNASQLLLHDLLRRNTSINVLDLNDNLVDMKFLHAASTSRVNETEGPALRAARSVAPAPSSLASGGGVSTFGAAEIEGVLARLRRKLLEDASFTREELVERIEAHDASRSLLLEAKSLMDVFAKFGIELDDQDLVALSSSFGMPKREGRARSRFSSHRPEFQFAYPFLVQSLVGGCEEEMRLFREKVEALGNP